MHVMLTVVTIRRSCWWGTRKIICEQVIAANMWQLR